MADKEYIERGALLKTPPFTKYGGDMSAYAEGYLDCAEDARKAVNDAPAADVVEVRCGTWTFNKDGSGTCDQCGKTQKGVWDYDNWQNYCGCCGADMRGERKEQT